MGAWIRFTGAERAIDSVTITQPGITFHGGWATRVEVLVDGRVVGTGSVGPGRHSFGVTPTVGRTVELRITSVSGSGTVTFLETDAAAGVVHFDAARAARSCVDIGTLDARPLRVHLVQPITSADAVSFGPCGSGTTVLPAGSHQLRGLSTWTVDSLTLRDTSGAEGSVRGIAPAVTSSSSTTSASVDVGASTATSELVLGQAFDPRWVATMDGRDLGSPHVVDGWSVGWSIPAGGPHHLEIRYEPQQRAAAALVASLAGVGLCGLLLLRSPNPVAGAGQPSPSLIRERRRRTVAAWAALLVGSWFLGGWIALAMSVVLAVWCAVRPPRTKVLVGLALALWAAAGIAFVVGNRERWGTVTPELVTRNVWPGVLSLLGLVVLVVAVGRQVAGETSGTLPDRG